MHCLRQNRYRERKRKNVTDHGSAKRPNSDTSPPGLGNQARDSSGCIVCGEAFDSEGGENDDGFAQTPVGGGPGPPYLGR